MAGELDPVARLTAYAVRAGLLDVDALEALAAGVRAEVDAALELALSYPAPGPDEVFRHVFAD